MLTTHTAAAQGVDSAHVAAQCLAQLQHAEPGAAPRYLLVQAHAAHDVARLAEVLRSAWPEAALHIATSCLGSMTEAGTFITPPPAVAVFAVYDAEGDYGTACAALGEHPQATAAALARTALQRAGRLGETPALVWVSASPGCEEAVIAGLQEVVGHATPVVGGSAADDAIAGQWQVSDGLGPPQRQGVVVSVWFPSTRVAAAFHSGYVPTAQRGRVTQARGRSVQAIDGEPAAAVYARWTGQAVRVPEQGTANVLMASALWPLGRQVGEIAGAPTYTLSHPETLSADGTLTLFTDVREGDELVLMSGSSDSLLQRPALVAEAAARVGELAEGELAGLVLVFCAGCMLTVQERLDEVRQSLRRRYPGLPFITAFTFGEQGPVLACDNRHGNLMISAVVLARS